MSTDHPRGGVETTGVVYLPSRFPSTGEKQWMSACPLMMLDTLQSSVPTTATLETCRGRRCTEPHCYRLMYRRFSRVIKAKDCGEPWSQQLELNLKGISRLLGRE